ncbi:MAG: hypothetical protein HQ582_28980 [Planctomycetes bacterium]|nr:hypothetical protein [Planctomycetota bacterium]
MKIFLDENFSKYIADALNCLQKGYRSEETEVLHIAEAFGKGSPDEEWIPRVAQMHGVILTEDMNIHRTKSQYALCENFKVGIVFFRPPKKRSFTYWQWVEIVMKHWAAIKEIAKNATRPFAYEITPRSKEPMPLP